MRTLMVVVVVGLVSLGGSSCGRKRVPVANTPEGKKCRRECMLVYQSCMGARGGGRHVCRNQENECLRTCPLEGEVAPVSTYQAVEAPPPPPPPGP